MKIRLGHTPDADDAFMFYAMINNKIEHEFEIENIIEDIESLNIRALNHELDVTAISVHAYAYTKDYIILRVGGSFGLGYGPIVIAKHKLDLKGAKIAIPGRLTTATLLLKLSIGEFDAIVMRFDEIIDAIINDKVDAGLLIHEAQITYQKYKLIKILDLGRLWYKNTNLPLPLGVNVASKKLGLDTIRSLNNVLKRSIMYAMNNQEEVIRYASRYGRGTDLDTLRRFINMYVNHLTLDIGIGEDAIRLLYELAYKNGYINNKNVEILS